jgi:hypothetical protein
MRIVAMTALLPQKKTAPAKKEAEAVFDALEQLFLFCSLFSRSGAPYA